MSSPKSEYEQLLKVIRKHLLDSDLDPTSKTADLLISKPQFLDYQHWVTRLSEVMADITTEILSGRREDPEPTFSNNDSQSQKTCHPSSRLPPPWSCSFMSSFTALFQSFCEKNCFPFKTDIGLSGQITIIIDRWQQVNFSLCEKGSKSVDCSVSFVSNSSPVSEACQPMNVKGNIAADNITQFQSEVKGGDDDDVVSKEDGQTGNGSAKINWTNLYNYSSTSQPTSFVLPLPEISPGSLDQLEDIKHEVKFSDSLQTSQSLLGLNVIAPLENLQCKGNVSRFSKSANKAQSKCTKIGAKLSESKKVNASSTSHPKDSLKSPDMVQVKEEPNIDSVFPAFITVTKVWKKKAKYRCELCNKMLSKSYFPSHMNLHLTPKQFMCNDCWQFFPSRALLNFHKSMHVSEERLCCICGAKLMSLRDIELHTQMHLYQEFQGDVVTPPAPSQLKFLRKTDCELCGKVFLSQESYNRHVRTHDRPYVCELCGKTFSTKSKLNEHIIYHKNRVEKPFVCGTCGKGFPSKGNLKNHLITHSDQKAFECRECFKKFKTIDVLRKHTKAHGEKNYMCSFCDARFHRMGSLKVHEMSHTGARPYICPECGKGFKTKSKLSTHIRYHNNDRRYRCDMCSRMFYNNTTLKIHKRIHTGEKPYSCHICGKKFSQSNGVKAHLKTH